MLAKTFAILCLLNKVVVAQDRNPETDGKYFYTDYKSGSQYGVKFIDMQVGEAQSKRKMNLFVTTSQSEATIITTECPNPQVCDIPAPFNADNVHKSSDTQYQTNIIRFFDKLQLQETKLTVHKAQEQFEMTYREYNRYAKFNANTFAVIDANSKFTSIYDGFVGLAPYSDNVERKKRNFLWQLKDAGMISNMIVAFYVKPQSGNTSTIKFGSWDKNAIQGDLLMFKTTSQYSWALDGQQFNLGTVDLALGHRFLELDPMFPFLYIPDADFQVFAKQVHKNYERFFQNNICDDAKCKWEKPCDQVEGKKDMNLGIRIQDFNTDHTYTVKEEDMFISGSEVGDDANHCYLAVFKSQTQQAETWYLGNVFMRDYYVVLDMTPKDSRGENFIQVGIAQQAPVSEFGNEHYNSTSETEDNLRPAFAALDTSKHISYRAPDDPDIPDTGGDIDPDHGDDGDGSDTILPDQDGRDKDEFQQFIQDNKVLVIVGGSAAIFLIISLLTCCCCCGGKKNRKDTYIYRTYSQLKGGNNDHVQALDEDDTPAGTRIQ